MNFEALRHDYDIVPIFRELSADTLTPVAAFAALAGSGDAFLFESVERGENVGRYSYVGFEPRRRLRFERDAVNAASVLNDELRPLRVYEEERLPPFFGGAVGYFGYGVAGWTERIPDTRPDVLHIPDAQLLFFDNVVVFDHVRQRLFVIASLFTADEHASVEEAEGRIERAIERLRGARIDLVPMPATEPAELESNFTREAFEQMIVRAKEEIIAGEIFQIVVAQQWSMAFPASDALTLYRALRSINPSPYLFLLRTSDVTLVGASPEMLVRVSGKVAETRPIAGTLPRGATVAEDKQFEARLIADPKENAEHLMLVDLGRNDLGRVAASGSVAVSEFRHVERYSHVMHLVTNVQARLREGRTAVDCFLSCFPAGTLTGAPKIRAMELIDELETVRRGPYGGAVAYFGFSGNLDSCITIRTAILANGRVFVQAGAGIVYDSDPAREYQETLDKSAALRRAIGMVEEMKSEQLQSPRATQ